MNIPKVYTEKRIVAKADLDEMQHVNNVVYLKFLQDVATNHWYSLASENLIESIRWIVRKHEIEYLSPARLNEELLIKTWVQTAEGVKSDRFYEITCQNKLVVKARTVWIAVDPVSQKPKRISGEIADLFFLLT